MTDTPAVRLNYEDLTELQVAVAQNEAADHLMTVKELILASQELYLNSPHAAADGEKDSSSHLNLFKGLTKIGRAIATPKKRSSVASFSTPERGASTTSTSAIRTPSKVPPHPSPSFPVPWLSFCSNSGVLDIFR